MSAAAQRTRQPASPAEGASTLPAWPADAVPSGAEAEHAMRSVLAGAPGALDAALVARVAGDLTPAERAAFAEEGDAAVALRAAAGLRWRLAAALATAPPTGSRMDLDAVTALVVDTDQVLAGLKRCAEGAVGALARDVARARDGVVRDAIALGNVVEAITARAGGAAPAAAPALRTRLLSLVEGEAPDRPERRGRAVWIALAVALAVAGAYHGWNLYERTRQPTVDFPTVAGAPAGMRGAVDPRSGARALVAEPGKLPAKADVAQFKADEREKGRVVREVAPGVLLSLPADSSRASSGGTP
jgi:hypothetical protein